MSLSDFVIIWRKEKEALTLIGAYVEYQIYKVFVWDINGKFRILRGRLVYWHNTQALYM